MFLLFTGAKRSKLALLTAGRSAATGDSDGDPETSKSDFQRPESCGRFSRRFARWSRGGRDVGHPRRVQGSSHKSSLASRPPPPGHPVIFCLGGRLRRSRTHLLISPRYPILVIARLRRRDPQSRQLPHEIDDFISASWNSRSSTACSSSSHSSAFSATASAMRFLRSSIQSSRNASRSCGVWAGSAEYCGSDIRGGAATIGFRPITDNFESD